MKVVWEIAHEPNFAPLVATGLADASPEHAHSVHVDATGLDSDTAYWYRFRAGDYTSQVGKTRTLPAAGAEPVELRLAFTSCQRYEDGYYSAWREMATMDLHLVLFLGDYIYELNRRQPVAGRELTAPEAMDLGSYRVRYALYKRDADLQAAHAAHPFVAVWDDHEVANNYGHSTDSAALARRFAGYKAWWENMPVRLEPPQGPDYPIHRNLEIGDLATIWLLDCRQYRSGEPECVDKRLDIPGLDDAAIVVDCAEVQDPARTMLGQEQRAWLLAGLAGSSSRWNVLAQQVLMASSGTVEGLPGPIALTDKWGGFQWERERILDAVAGPGNAVVLSGDLHSAAVCRLSTAGTTDETPAATEFMAPPISSRFSRTHNALAELVMPFLPGVDYFGVYPGFATCTITRELWETTFWRVADVTDPGAAVEPAAVWAAAAGTPGAHRLA